MHLVLDPSAGRIVYASAAARALADAFVESDLTALVRQITGAAPADAAPRLARLRLDTRRIAPPVLCWLARGTRDDGTPAILVIPTTPVPPPRPKPAPAHASRPPATPPKPEWVAVAPKRADRFLWRVDAAGILTTLTGPPELANLVGQPVQELAESGRIAGADGVLAALHERRTFRGERATFNASVGAFEVELSGAPLGRGDAAFSGFGGFGLIRGAPPALFAADGVPEHEVLPQPVAAPEVEATLNVDAIPKADVTSEADAGPEAEASPEAEAFPEADAVPEAEPAPDAEAASPAPVPPGAAEVGSAGTALSTDEHAAFREIARALGARYAGDEAEPDASRSRPESGAIMPFPGSHAGPPELPVAAAPTADTGILAGLPVPALVHRGDAILAANPPLLALTGHADMAALVAAGLGGLFPALPQETAARRTTLTAADGRARPVEAHSGPCRWADEPAECLIVRPMDEADAADALTAERLARTAQAERTASAEAALDALESGVVTLDGAGRIVAMNRAAADLLSCDPREVVGSSFVSLFERASVLTVADLLRGAVRGPRAVSLAGRTVALDVRGARDNGHRVAVLDHPSARPGIVQSDASGQPGAALNRLDRAFREPLAGMIALADAMLKEPFGPLGDTRYRGCLGEIQSSGEAMLERVGKLLDLAAVEAGSLRLEPRALDLNDLAAGCVARLQAEAARGRIVVRTSFSSDLGDLEADEHSVSRAASLVIEHAIRRSTAGGQIIVSTGSTEQAAIALRVRDTGAGAAGRPAGPAGEVEDNLALPRALVEANGGRLQLSARPEDGTLVEIIMPTRRAANG